MASPELPERYRFGSFDLQPGKRRLLRDGATISLRPRAFDLLVVLVDRAGHLVAKDELLDRVWPKMVVEEAALHVQVSALRKVVGSDAITTVSGRGYQFTLPVTKDDGEANRASRSKHNLPYPLTSFVGREREIAQLEELVAANRLVTLTGAGGAGKTRLAIQVATRLADAFADGVRLVELAPLSEPSLVPQAIMSALGLREQPGQRLIDTIGEHLCAKRLLLAIDNAEHLLGACADLVEAILQRSRHATILVTSRERLGLAGEQIHRVPSLGVPGPDAETTADALLAYEGVQLFVQRARLLRPEFAITAENAVAVASVCRRLDGMPLALELAAPRLRSMSPQELSQRLDHRFSLLADGSRAALPRQRTLRATIDWSYDLLSDVEQATLRRLSVFAGGWTLSSAEALCSGDGIEHDDVIDLLTVLADKNLIVSEERAGATRYQMLESVRQYACDRLRERNEDRPWRDRHLAHIAALGMAAKDKLVGPEQREGLARLADEYDNFRAALSWAVESSATDGLSLLRILQTLWMTRGHLAEGRAWCARLLDATLSSGAARDRARAAETAAILATLQGDYAAARALFEQNLALYREINDPLGIARSLSGSAHMAAENGDAEAEALCREALAHAREVGDQPTIAQNLANLAIVVEARGDRPEALALLRECEGVAREIGHPSLLGIVWAFVGYFECSAGQHDAARAHLTEGIAALQEVGDRTFLADALDGVASLATATGTPARAARLFGAIGRLRQDIGAARGIPFRNRYPLDVSAARVALGDEGFEQAWAEGRAMTLEEVVRYALA